MNGITKTNKYRKSGDRETLSPFYKLISYLLVEQNVRQALKVAEYGYVLETGKVVVEGKSSELLQDSRIMDAYLGRQ